MEPHHHCMSWVLPKWTVSWFLMRIMESPITHNGQKVVSKRGAKVGLDSLKWVLILDELWLTEVTLLKCGYCVKASNIWNRVRERYWKKFVVENWEDKRWRKCGWEKTEEKRNKKRVLCWLWLTEVTLLKKCGYRVKASNIWNGVRYWKKFVEENWENGEIKKIKGKWHVAEKKRKKKEIKKRVTSGGLL